MKAFSFLSILKNFGKQLFSLASQMPWCNLRFNLGSISVLSRVSGPFSRTSFGTSRRASHFAAMIFAVLVMSIANIGMAWGAVYKTYSLSDLTNTSLTYEKTGLSNNDQKLNKGERKVEVPCASASGTLYLSGTGENNGRYASIYKNKGTEYDVSNQIAMTEGYNAKGIPFSASDLLEDNGKYYIIFGAGTESGDLYDYKITAFKYTLSEECPSCTKPTSVVVTPVDEFGWRYSIGETISLKATYEGGAGTPSYQWQKFIGDTWTNINGATAATYTKTNCTTGDGGSYRCVVSTGNDCSYESEGYFVRVFTLNGGYTNNDWTAHKIDWTDENTGVVTISLPVSETYYFKVTDNDGKWFGYGDASNYIIQPWQADCGTGNSNIRLFTGPAGDYKFTINIEHAQENSPYVNIKVDYPEVTHPVEGYAYINKWWDCYVHYWEGASNALTTWGSDPKINNDRYVNICGTDYWYFPVIETYTNFIAKDKEGDPTNNNTTGDQSTTNRSGQNITHNGTAWVWQEFSTYSITFNANGGTGSMPIVTGITCDGSATLTPNAFNRTGYTFAGWATSADGEKVYNDQATISNITSDITLYAKWNINSYNTTTNFTNVSMTGEEPLNQFPSTLQYGSSLSRTFVADAGYSLPETITVTGAEYTWNPSTGVLSITNVTGEVSVTITGELVEYTITYEGLEGATHSNPDTYTIESGTITFIAPSERTGYTFAGWEPTSIEQGSTGNKTVTATWMANTYTITLNTNGGTINADNVTSYTYGVGATLPVNVTKAGFTFGGWYDNEGCTGDEITTISSTATGDKTYWAKWTAATIDPTTTWTVAETVYAGQLVSVSVTTNSDATLTTGSLTTNKGTLVNATVNGQTITATLQVPGDASGTITLTLETVATENYNASTSTKTITLSECPTNGSGEEDNTTHSTTFVGSSSVTGNWSGSDLGSTDFNDGTKALKLPTQKTLTYSFPTVVQLRSVKVVMAFNSGDPNLSWSLTAKDNNGNEIKSSTQSTTMNKKNVQETFNIPLEATNVKTVVLNNSSGKQMNVGEITFTIVSSSGSGESTLETNLAWSTDLSARVEKQAGTTFTYTASSNNSAGTITYSSSNTDVAAVNPTTGEVTTKAAGTTTITATIAAIGCYPTKSINYTLNVTSTDEPEPDNCGISECGNATLTYTINASTETTNTADNLLSSAAASNTTALGVNNKAVFSTITADDGKGKAAAATNECFNPAPVMSSKITMYKGSSYDANTYLQFTFTVKSGYTFTPCDVQFIVQPVMSDANFRWVITDGTTEYGSGTANDVPVGADNGATALLGLSSTSAMPAGTYYIRLYPYDNDGDNNSFRISNDVILKGTIEEVVCTELDAPTEFTVGSITSNGATFTITDEANTNNYEIYYSTTSTAPTAETEATITTTEKTKAITGLTAETTYYAWARAICNEENKSSWVALTDDSFTTSADPEPSGCITITDFDTDQKTSANGKPDANAKYLYGYTDANKTPEYAYTITTNKSNNVGKNDGAELYLYYGTSVNIYADNTTTGGTPQDFSGITYISIDVKMVKSSYYSSFDIKVGDKVIADDISLEGTAQSNYVTFEYNVSNLDGKVTIIANGSSTNHHIYVDNIKICTTALPSCTTPVLEDLSAQTKCPGEDVTWTANNTEALQDGETIAYQWTKKGNATILSPTATLTLNDVTEATGGTYVVTATVSADGKASKTASKEVTLTVNEATEVTAITADKATVYPTNSVTLTATANMDATWQWYTCTNAEGDGESSISGATSASYTIASAGSAGTYYYKVKATGDCGTAENVYTLVISPAAGGDCFHYVSVLPDNNISPSSGVSIVTPTYATTLEGGTMKVGSQQVTITKNGLKLENNKSVSITLDAALEAGNVVIVKGSTATAGCGVTINGVNFYESDSKTFDVSYTVAAGDGLVGKTDLTVTKYSGSSYLQEIKITGCGTACTDPEVTASSDNTTACVGTSVTFTATGAHAEATYQWQKYSGGAWTDISGATNATYTIASVATTDAMKYRVIASHDCNRMSNEVTLSVPSVPDFGSTVPASVSVMQTIALSINTVEATDAVKYRWYKSADATWDAGDVEIGTNKELIKAYDSEAIGSPSYYIFCRAQNACGITTSTAIAVNVTVYVEEDCATRGNEIDAEFGFEYSAGQATYNSTACWSMNDNSKKLIYTAPEGKYFKTMKVTIASSSASQASYNWSIDGGSSYTADGVAITGVTTTLTEKTIDLSAHGNVNEVKIGRNFGNGESSGTLYVSKICFEYTSACTATTVTPSESSVNYEMGGAWSNPTFTLSVAGTLTYSSSNEDIASVDDDGTVTFNGEAGTVTITASYAGGTISATEYCASSGSYTINVSCPGGAPKIVAAGSVNMSGCNSSVTLNAKTQVGADFADGTYQWFRNGEEIDGATSSSYTATQAGTYTVERTNTSDCTTPSTNSAIVTSETTEPEVERLVPFQYYHVDKTYTDQMKMRHLFAVKNSGKLDGKSFKMYVSRNGGAATDVTSSNALVVWPNGDGHVDTVMVDLNKLSGKYSENDELVFTCKAIDCSSNISEVYKNTITIHVIDQTPTLALICSGANGDGTRKTSELTEGGDFLTGYNKADLCQQTGSNSFDPNIEWGFYTELKKEYRVTPVNGYAPFNKLNYEPFDILLLTDYPKSSKSEAAATILDDMAELCDYRPLLSFKTHMVAKSPSKWAKKGFTTSPVVPAQPALYADIVCYAHPMFSNINNTSYTYHNDADHDQLIYKILDRAGYEKNKKIAKGIQGFELADASNFVTIGLIHNDASAAEVDHTDADFNGDGMIDEKDIHKHVQWTNGENDRKLAAIAERQANVEARMILFSINCGAQSLQTEGGRQVILQCLKYLYNAENLIEPAECHLTFDNKHGDNKWSNHLNWAPRYEVRPTENDEVRIAAPCTVDITDASVLSVQILEGGSLTINQGAALVVAGPITRFDKETDISSATESEDILIGSDDKGNGTLIFSNANGTTKATVQMYSTAKADMVNMSAATSTWQYIGTPHSDVQNAADNYYESWLYQYGTESQSWEVIPNGGPLDPFRGYCITHPEQVHTYTMTGTLVTTMSQSIDIPAGKYVVVANSWTAPIQVANFADADLENITEKTVYLFNTGSDPEGDNDITTPETAESTSRYAANTYVAMPIHAATYIGCSTIPSMQGFYVVGGETDGQLHLDYDQLVRPQTGQSIVGEPMHAPARRVAADDEPQVAKFLFRGKRYDDRLIILERPDFTRGYDSGWDGEQWGGNAAAPMSYVVTETRWDAVSAIPEYEGTVIAFRAGEDSEYTIHFDYDGMEDALYLLDTDTQIYTRVLKGNSYTFTCGDKAEHNRFILTRKAPQIATGTDHINTGENAKAVKFIKDDKIFIFVNGMLYDATGKMVIR